MFSYYFRVPQIGNHCSKQRFIRAIFVRCVTVSSVHFSARRLPTFRTRGGKFKFSKIGSVGRKTGLPEEGIVAAGIVRCFFRRNIGFSNVSCNGANGRSLIIHPVRALFMATVSSSISPFYFVRKIVPKCALKLKIYDDPIA